MSLLEFDATIINSLFRNKKNYFTIALARIDNKVETIIGFFPIFNDGLIVHCHGKKEKGRHNKEQFRVESYSFELPTTEHGMYYFLTNDYLDMDVRLASNVMEKVGLSYLEEYSNVGLLEKKLGAELYKAHKKELYISKLSLDAVKEKLTLMNTLIEMGFANEISSKISFSEFKTNAVSVKQNPYQLIFPFDLTWKFVDGIALKNGIDTTSELRIKEGICYLLDEAVQKHAHIYLPRPELHTKLLKLLHIRLDIENFKMFEKVLRDENRVYCDVEYHLYGYRYFKAELQLSKDLYRLNDGELEKDEVITEILNVIDSDDIEYSPEQKESIIKAIKFPFLIISGAAGTGKTTVVKKIVDTIDAFKNDGKKFTDDDYYHIKLCAPTGRASERMKEVTGRDAQTIHSLLNHNPLTKEPLYNEKNPIVGNCFVVDESSMNDTILFSELLNAIASGSKVIVVGDVDQLPSIGPGNVLQELLQSTFEKVILTRVYRQGADSKILDLATSIREGDTNIIPILKEKNPELSFVYNQDIKAISDIIIQTAAMLLDKEGFDFYKDFQIITPIHKTEIGTVALNNRIQQLVAARTKNKKSVTLGNNTFFTGDKVIHLTNNKEKRVFNGEIGKVVSIVNKTVYVLYGEKEVSYTNDELFDINLAYVTSVHKMQGSESAIVLFPVHHCYGMMLQRRLLYTGITRAKRKLLLVGDPDAIIKAIATDDADKRNCNLKQRLVESKLSHLFN